ncbi:6509_t:CDS:2, partial [Racocetra persica]
MEHDVFEETVEGKIFGNFSFDLFPYIVKNKYDIVDIRELTCKYLHKTIDKYDIDKLDKIINKMSEIFEDYIIQSIDSNEDTNNNDDMNRLEDQIIEHLSSDISKLANLFAAFSTEILHSDEYGMIDLRPYKLAGINTSVLNAGIFSRAGNQVKLSQIIKHLRLIIDTNFIEEYNKRINRVTNKSNIYNVMINSIASNLTPFGKYPTPYDRTLLDENISFIQLLYRDLGGNDVVKQRAFDRIDPAIIPSLTEMHRNIIKFIPLDDRILEFKFEKGKVRITKLFVHPHWIETLWNIVLLEMRSKCEPIVGTLICFYAGIIKSKEDFNLAHHLGIIYSGPMNFARFHEIMSKLSEMCHYITTVEGSKQVKSLISTVRASQDNALLQFSTVSSLIKGYLTERYTSTITGPMPLFRPIAQHRQKELNRSDSNIQGIEFIMR